MNRHRSSLIYVPLPFNCFSYDYYTKSGSYLYSKKLKTDKLVFGAYKSFRKDENNKPKNAVLHWLIITLFFIGCGVGLFAWAIGGFQAKAERAKQITAPQYPRLSPEAKQKILDQNQVPVSVVAPDPAPVVVQSQPGIEWRGYQLDGWLKTSDGYIYLIKGRRFNHSSKFRNFLPDAGYVEYYGPEIVSAGVAAPRANVSQAASSPGSAARVKALAVTRQPVHRFPVN